MKSNRAFVFFLILVPVAGFVLGCRPSFEEPSIESIQIPTETALEGTGSGEKSTDVAKAVTPTPEQLPAPAESVQTPVGADTPNEVDRVDSDDHSANESLAEQEFLYRVAFVENGDSLNVREGPGVAYSPVSELFPGNTSVRIIGAGKNVGNSLWVPIEVAGTSGWVNSRYLTMDISAEGFCSDNEAAEFNEMVQSALTNEDGTLLAEMIPDNRALRIRRHWWNNEVLIDHEDAGNLFDSDESIAWGEADGSGSPIEGSFADVISPLLKKNLTSDNVLECNNIVHGGTAGIVKLPDSYEGINYYSSYRQPGSEDFELDWGTWVIGVEKWQGKYSLSFLIHYEWEI